MSDAKLALAEYLLGSDEPAAFIQHGLQWLSEHAAVKQGLCAVLQEDPKKLEGVASLGVDPVSVENFVLDLEDRGHPLVSVLAKRSPVFFAAGPKQPHTPLEGTSFYALPLGSREAKGEQGVGVLLVSSETQDLKADVRWFAELLGEKLVRLRYTQLIAERRFARERSLLYTIINAVTDPILLTDTEGKLIIANARAEKLFAARDDDSEGRRRAVALNNMLFSAALSSRAMLDAEPARNELLLVDPTEGSDLLFELLSSPVRDFGGETGVVSVLRNVTDLGRATEEMGESYRKLRLAQAEAATQRHRLDLIIDSVADPIVVTDPAGDIVLMNAPAEKLFTVPVVGDEEAQRRVRANDAHFSSFVSNLLFSGSELRWRGEISLVEPEAGRPMPVEAVAGKILSERGELQAVVTILHDRTEAIENMRLYDELKKVSDQLEQKVQAATAELAQQNELLRRQAIELEQASAAKSQFLANMSHEFRTPLNAILGYTNMLIQGVSGGLSPAQKKSLLRIDSNGRHLLEVINEILDITRIEAGRMPLHLSEFEIQELIGEVMSELEPIIVRSKLEVSTDLGRALPKLRSDRQKVKQIVLNLLSNALKFTHQGSIAMRAEFDPKEKMLHVSVRDTGIGISPEDHEKVFEDFKQVDNSPTRAYGGTGLGLSICRRLAAMLDGTIELESALGKGSTFTLSLPAKPRKR